MYEDIVQKDMKKFLKFMFSKKATKIDEIFTIDLRLCSKCQIDSEDFVNFCDLLRKHELYQKRCQKDFDSIEGHCHRKGSKHHKPKGSSQYPAPLTYFYWKEARVRQAHKWSEIFSKFSGFPVWSSKFNCLTWKSEKKLWKTMNYTLQKFNQNLLMITRKIVGPHIKPWIPNDYYPEFEETYEVHW